MNDISCPAVYRVIIRKGVSILQVVFQAEHLRIGIGAVGPAVGIDFGNNHGGEHLQSV